MNYLIKSRQKRDIRLLLRDNNQQEIIYSSLYKIDDFNYILLHVKDQIHFPQNTKTQLVVNRTNAEGYLFKWAQSEILQSLDYIQFEQNSTLSGNNRMADHFGVLIYRSSESLADIFAVLNYTSDSFSDGGRFNQVDSAIKQIEYLCSSGATIIDFGVQSTRPTTDIVLDAAAEIKLLKQILPHVLKLKSELNFELSIDTYHSDTVLWLAEYPVDVINDVSGKLPIEVVKQILDANKRYVAMHSLSIPASPEIVLDENINPLDYVYSWMMAKVEMIANAGCNISNLILDPGIGFGLTAAQSWFILRHLRQLNKIPCEILVGNSRKSFFAHITSIAAHERDLETSIVTANILPYVDYLRLHDLRLFNRVNQVFNQFG